MRLTDEEQAMLAGEFGAPRRWAIAHQIVVGEFFDAANFVAVSQAHIMADTESLGEAGVAFLEGLAAAPEPERRVRVPSIPTREGSILRPIAGSARVRRWRHSSGGRSTHSPPLAC